LRETAASDSEPGEDFAADSIAIAAAFAAHTLTRLAALGTLSRGAGEGQFMTAQTLLELRGIDKLYGDTQVLRNIDLAIDDGEFITVLGPSGSGKTTVLRLIGGFTQPTRGAIIFEGADIARVPSNKRPFNTVFQDYALFPHMTVEENVGYGLRVRRVDRTEIRVRVADALGLVALDKLARRYPAQLSGGQKQRVALARAIICGPRLILLDEPLGALDAELRRQMQLFLKRLQKEIRTTFLFVTHDQEEAITMADRICVMNHGVIVQIGSPKEVYYRPGSEYVARFFGDNNLIDGSLGDGAAGERTLDTALGRLRCRVDDQPGLAGLPAGHKAKLAVRPEAIEILAPGAAADNVVEARLEEVNFTGPISQLVARPLASPAVTLSVKRQSRAAGQPVEPGVTVRLGWSASEGRLVSE
jgi:spermidine/putrescine transport system ATP-binding protein